ncbi:hypothetical protein KFO32_20230, partial [Pantoea ananatis]|uniref:hypothetical protein n=2 Tax=Pantoea ananas TaxID=553 RepID=UPI001FF454E7
SEVKRRSADGSVGSPHARVGNCQASNRKAPYESMGLFYVCDAVKKSQYRADYGVWKAPSGTENFRMLLPISIKRRLKTGQLSSNRVVSVFEMR